MQIKLYHIRFAYRSVISPVESMWSNGDENPLPVVQLVNSIYVHGVLEVRRRQLQKPLDLCAPIAFNADERIYVLHGCRYLIGVRADQ